MTTAAEPVYAVIDLKSFYSSVECIQRRLDPLTTHLLVADESRSDKTICLAVSPSLKALGVSGRPRLFEAVQAIQLANVRRLKAAGLTRFSGSSHLAAETSNPRIMVQPIIAPPHMGLYMSYSSQIYGVYLRYVSSEDIHVYSVDEVMIDLTPYQRFGAMSPRQMVKAMLLEVMHSTGITAAAGMGTNLYLAKVALDILAKKEPPDGDGACIAWLDEQTYREKLWSHRPITDFWHVGSGYAARLQANGMFTMGDVARRSLRQEELLYRLFGVHAEVLIDHAWGWEPVTMRDIRSYRPKTHSLSSGQVLPRPYGYEEACLIVREMTELLALDMVEKRVVANQVTLTLRYDTQSLSDPQLCKSYQELVAKDRYGRSTPGHAHGTFRLHRLTASGRLLTQAMMTLFRQIADPMLLIRQVTLAVHGLIQADDEPALPPRQLDMFSIGEDGADQAEEETADLKRERRRQKAVVRIQRRFGRNAIFRGMNLQPEAMTRTRNQQIGGHSA